MLTPASIKESILNYKHLFPGVPIRTLHDVDVGDSTPIKHKQHHYRLNPVKVKMK